MITFKANNVAINKLKQKTCSYKEYLGSWLFSKTKKPEAYSLNISTDTIVPNYMSNCK